MSIPNNTTRSADESGTSSLLELLRQRALTQPQCSAFIYLYEGENEATQLTFGELDQQARVLGGLLQSMKVKGERALLIYPAGPEFAAAFFGCIYGEVVAVPITPPNPARLGRSLPLFQAVVRDAQPVLALTTRSVLDKFEPLLASNPGLKSLRWIATDTLTPETAEEWSESRPRGDSLAYLQYTSGSTSLPKGVMVSHDNVLYNAGCLEADWEHTDDSVIVNWLPHFHDFGLLYGYVQPVYSSIPSVLMQPTAFLQKPLRWLDALSRYEGSHTAAPNFAYDLCVRKTTPEQRAALVLNKWRVAGNGGEPIRRETLENFGRAFEVSGFSPNAFCPGWGLAEGTLRVTGTRHADAPVYKSLRSSELRQGRVVELSEPEEEDAQTIVSSGSPAAGTEIVVVDPETLKRCSPDAVGEAWVAGPCVTQGYWRRPEETQETFGARLSDTGEGPFLRTGDLAFMRDNVIFMAGRLKDLIIIRGSNRYPQDIELAAERSHPSTRPGCGAAFTVEVGGEERLVLVQEVDDRADNLDEVVTSLRRAMASSQDVQAYAVTLIRSGTIPKTSSGKIQRRACREEFMAGKLEALAEWRAKDN